MSLFPGQIGCHYQSWDEEIGLLGKRHTTVSDKYIHPRLVIVMNYLIIEDVGSVVLALLYYYNSSILPGRSMIQHLAKCSLSAVILEMKKNLYSMICLLNGESHK